MKKGVEKSEGYFLKNYKEIFAIILISILFLSINYSVFDKAVYGADAKTFQRWGSTLLKGGTKELYNVDGSSGQSDLDYPPLYLPVLKLNVWIDWKITGNLYQITPTFIKILKTFPILCNLAIGLTLFFYLRKKSKKIAYLTLLLYLFNPVTIHNAAVWGQIDSVHTLLMLLSIIFLAKEKYTTSSIFLTIALLTKLQSIVIAPVIITIILLNCKPKKIIKIILINLILATILLLPQIIAGAMPKVIDVYFNTVGRYNRVTMNAYNFWFLVSPESPQWWWAISDTTKFLGITLKQIGLTLFGLYTALVVYQLTKKRSKETIFLAASSLALAFFILPTQIHERYMFSFFALFALVMLKNKKYLVTYIILAITHLFNMMMVLKFSGKDYVFMHFANIINFITKRIALTNLATIIAMINVLTFIYISKQGILKGLTEHLKKDIRKITRKIKS
ncbi:hypothetical protein GOV14_03380 [Candidatus Pacearchaeota archaeon]|nr:hypothetical protein [Candidatus Pacearchaeota archaeon]